MSIVKPTLHLQLYEKLMYNVHMYVVCIYMYIYIHVHVSTCACCMHCLYINYNIGISSFCDLLNNIDIYIMYGNWYACVAIDVCFAVYIIYIYIRRHLQRDQHTISKIVCLV